MTYELWHNAEEDSYALFESTDDAARAGLDNATRCMMAFEAESIDDARRRQHAFLGWKPYNPENPHD